MPDTTPAPMQNIRDAADAITAPPPQDPDRLLETVASIRQTMRPDDPGNLYFNKHSLVAAEHAKLDAFLARHGIKEPTPETPQQRAAREVEAAFPSRGQEIEPHLQQIIDDDLAALEKLPREEQERRASDLRREHGADYLRLVEQARAALGPNWKEAVASSRHALQVYAGLGRYRAAYDRAKSSQTQPKRS